MLDIKNITIAFGGKKVLNKCNMKIEEKKITSLVGPNGCGKTTLFNIASNLLNADEGEILFKKNDLCKLKTNNIEKLKIIRTFQDPKLFKNLTVEEHLILSIKDNSKLFSNILGKNALTKDEKKKIDETLKNLELDKKKQNKPDDLSGGQRKLLDLATSLVKDFEIVLLDEPLAGVSPRLRKLILNTILKLKEEGKTIFLIEHDMKFVMDVSDEIIVLNDGKVLKKGKPNEIKNDKEVLKAYLGG